jgi:hypothetical protein
VVSASDGGGEEMLDGLLAEERFDVHKINQRILAVMGIAGSGTEFPKMNSDVETSASVPQAGL